MNRKIEIAKKKRAERDAERAENKALVEKQVQAQVELKDAIDKLWELLNGTDEYDFDKLHAQLVQIDKRLDLAPHFKSLERSITTLSNVTTKTKIDGFSKLLQAVKDNKTVVNIDLKTLEKTVVDISRFIKEQSKSADQGAEDYQPVRRVVKLGNRFFFDDVMTSSGSGGGGSSGGGGGGDTTVTNFPTEYPLPAAQVTTLTPPAAITGFATSANQTTIIGHIDGIEGSVDQIEGYVDGIEGLLTTIDGDTGTIATEVAGLLTDTELRATPVPVDTGLTIPTDGLTDTELRATPVPVSGTVTATPTGTQNVDVTANTIGLSTSANQTNGTQQTKLTDGTNTVAVGSLGDGDGSRQSLVVDGRMRMYNGTSFDRIRGNTTDGLLVNLGANNDVTVTSGAITETNSAAIKAAVETIDNAISGSEMQVDVVGALPAGTNNIGDVDVLSLPALPTGSNAIGKLAANSGVDIGDVDVTSSVSATLDHGSNLDIDTTAEQITTTSFAAKFGVTVKSAADNTDTVYIGNSDVTAGTTAATDGFPLEPGESITLPVNNSNLLYAIGAAANQKVFWSAV